MGGLVFAALFLALAFALFFVAVGIELTSRRRVSKGIQKEVARFKRNKARDEL